MAVLANRARMATATTGTGTITLGSAVSGYQTFADAGVANGEVVRYVIEDGTAWEIGTGTYTASGTTLSRTVLESSNAGAAINLSGSAEVFITAAAEDISQPGHTHTIANVTNLQTELDGKASTGHTHAGVYEPIDPDILRADTADQLTAAFTSALDDDGSQSSGTYTPSVVSGSNSKRIANGGAFTLAPPAPASNEVIHLSLIIENVSGAGAITTSGFTAVAGASFTTTLNDRFLCHVAVFNIGGTPYSFLDVVAL